MANKIFTVTLLDGKKTEVYNKLKASVLALSGADDSTVEDYVADFLDTKFLELVNSGVMKEARKNATTYSKADLITTRSLK